MRQLLYMPALTATRCNPDLKRTYETLVAKGKRPKVDLTAVMRKRLVLARIRHQGHCRGQISVLGGAGGQIRVRCGHWRETGICDLGAVTGLVLLDRDAIREFGACQGTPRSEAVRGGSGSARRYAGAGRRRSAAVASFRTIRSKSARHG